jgi:isopentenyldiphosphate isomerase
MLLQYRVVDNKKDELLDIVDINDQVVGVEPRQSFKDSSFNPIGKFVRVVNCFIVNNEHKIWIPIRSPNKRSFPNSFDFSCGGYVQSGETYEQAMVAEIKEENNIETTPDQLTFLGKLTPKDKAINVFMGVYKLNINSEINYNKDDFTSAEWLCADEIISKIKQGFPTKSHLLTVINKFKDQL